MFNSDYHLGLVFLRFALFFLSLLFSFFPFPLPLPFFPPLPLGGGTSTGRHVPACGPPRSHDPKNSSIDEYPRSGHTSKRFRLDQLSNYLPRGCFGFGFSLRQPPKRWFHYFRPSHTRCGVVGLASSFNHYGGSRGDGEIGLSRDSMDKRVTNLPTLSERRAECAGIHGSDGKRAGVAPPGRPLDWQPQFGHSGWIGLSRGRFRTCDGDSKCHGLIRRSRISRRAAKNSSP